MKKSISNKLFLLIAGSILFVVVIYIILNTFILEDFYIGNKKSELVKDYKKINKYYNKLGGANDDSFKMELEKICENKNVSVTIMSESGTIIYSFGNPMEIKKNGQINKGFGSRFTNSDREYIFSQLETFANYTFKEELESNEKYIIDLYSSDKLDSDFIILKATLYNGDFLTLRASVQSITENAKISNKFMLMAGGIAIVLGAAIAFVLSQQFTKPIQELSNISQSMTNLDFTKKYVGESEDELGILGSNINTLSQKLETTIRELKEANIELEKDIEKKSRVDEMRKQFLSDVSHELKTPIALIQGYAEGLVENVVSDEESKKYYCNVILDESAKMDKLVSQLLMLSRIEYGNQELEIKEFDIVKLVNDVIRRTKVMAQDKNINVILKNSPNALVVGDEFMIEQAVTNYITNAIKHVDEKNIIEITIEGVENGKIRVSVFNTGTHIPEENLNKIWDRFYKEDKSRNREKGGTGIGLALVKAIATRHNNKYGVQNVEDGVVFYFELDESDNH